MSQNEHRRTQADLANDGTNVPTPENAHGVGAQQQGAAPLIRDGSVENETEGSHGGNHGNDSDNSNHEHYDGGHPKRTAKGSSHRGDVANAASDNTGGGSDKEHKNQTKNTTADHSDYDDGNAAPSPANNGGKIGDADNPA